LHSVEGGNPVLFEGHWFPPEVMYITYNAGLSFHPIFVPLNQLFGVILDLGFWIADLLYRFALSFSIKLTEYLKSEF